MDKDPMIKFRSTSVGKNKKGGDRTQLYLAVKEAETLIEALTNALSSPAGQEKGIKLDIHTSEKEYQGRTFMSSIAFVKAVSDGPGAGKPAARKFVPKQLAQ